MAETPKEDADSRPVPSAEPALIAASDASGPPSETEIAQQRAAEFRRVLLELTPKVVVTPVLVAINVVVFVLMLASGVHIMNPTVPDLVKWGADFGPNVLGGEWWRIVTCMFLHIGIIHLALNMFVLASVGPLVERMVGNVGFLVLYFVAGLGGSLLSLCWHPLIVSAGASGAVFGVYGALIAILRQKSGAVPAEILTRIRNSGFAFVGYNLIFGFMATGIDNAAHIGGLVVGFVCGLVLSQPLALESRAKRPARNVLAMLLGVVVVTAGMIGVHTLHPDLGYATAEVDRFGAIEERALKTYNAGLAKAERQEITEQAFADIIERDILPEWRDSVEKLTAVKNAPPDLQRYITSLLGYARLRQEAWELYVGALREQNPSKLQQAFAKQNQAEEAAKKLTTTPGK